MDLFRKYNFILISIVILGGLFRFYDLGNFPLGFHRDEAYLGYNAYSILKTGRDLTGNLFPIHIESFIFSPAGYIYASIPYIAIFGLSEFSTRFASALFGTLSIVLIYFVCKNLFRDYKYKEALSLISALFLSLLPWHIILSRTATENTIVTFFILLSIIIFYKWNKKKSLVYLVLTMVTLGSTYLMYQAPRAFVPLFAPILLLLIPIKKIWKNNFKTACLYLVILILPVLFIIKSEDLSLRIRSLSIFESKQVSLTLIEQISTDGVAGLPYLATRIFHNKYIVIGTTFLENYFSHFTYSFLFTDNIFPERYIVPQQGIIYIILLPFLIFGSWSIISKYRRTGLFLILWILFSPIGSSLTFDDTQNIQRTLFAAPPYVILAAFGFIEAYSWLMRRDFLKNAFLIGFSFLCFYSVAMFFVQYFYQAPYFKPWLRQDGYKELIGKINLVSNKYEKIVITNRESAPTIFLLFFNKYDPQKAQKAMEMSPIRDTDRTNFDKYVIQEEECPLRIEIDKENKKMQIGKKGFLYVNSSLCELEKLPSNAKLLDTVKRKDGSKAFYIMEIE